MLPFKRPISWSLHSPTTTWFVQCAAWALALQIVAHFQDGGASTCLPIRFVATKGVPYRPLETNIAVRLHAHRKPVWACRRQLHHNVVTSRGEAKNGKLRGNEDYKFHWLSSSFRPFTYIGNQESMRCRNQVCYCKQNAQIKSIFRQLRE